MNHQRVRFVVIIATVVFGTATVKGQNLIPEILVNGTLSEQMNYIETKTLIYENYRAVREDMFQKVKNNVLDSLAKAKNNIAGFVALTGNLNYRIDSLISSLNVKKEEANNLSRTKNSIRVIGIELNKTAYNSLMWTILAIVISLLAIGFLAFKRNITITLNTKRELQELKTEFEAYRQKTRLEREKVSMDHFNEIRKLKGR
jgi:wyosine [tRNA(Phe)-imidazoG37] synthetase (radical SAM superfamily)